MTAALCLSGGAVLAAAAPGAWDGSPAGECIRDYRVSASSRHRETVDCDASVE